MKNKLGLLWFRNDLRLHDNETLVRALQECETILPIFCYEPKQYRLLDLGFRKTGIHRYRFLCQCLLDLRENFQKRGSNLLITQGDPAIIISELAKKYGVAKVYAQKEVASEEIAVEKEVTVALQKQNIALELVWGKTLYHLKDIPYEPHEIPLVSKTFRIKTSKTTTPRNLFPTPETIATAKLRDWGTLVTANDLGFTVEEQQLPPQDIYKGGETSALARLQYYTFESELLTSYKWTRNRSLGMDYSSKFSPWMAYGCLSPRKIYHTVKDYE